MAAEFVKMDLHIHTPASDCYKGKNTDEEYLNILRQAKTKGIEVIAITDHNSIKGYSEYLSLENKLIKRKKEIKSSKSNNYVSELKRIEKDLSLFKEIVIFPGLEFETKNNVHMLIIFNKNTPVEIIEQFLCDSGYRNFGEENPKVTSNWDILDLYSNSKSYECIIIDAHTDSNKGIWTQTNPGSYRARCFTAPELYGIGYNSESQREHISNILLQASDYSRDNPISFVKFSDAHSCNDVGSQFTWLRKNDSYNLSYLKIALRNPTEYVSVEVPSLAKILNRIIRLPTTFGIKDITDENKEYYKKLVCGLNNSEGGYILFGVSSEKKKLGIDKGNIKDEKKITNEIDDCTKDIEGSPKLRKNIYPYISDKAIFSIRVLPGEEIIGIKNDAKVYSIKNNRLITLSPQELQNLVEAKFMDKIETKISKRIQEVERDCAQIKAYFGSFPIIRKFELMSNLANFEKLYEESIELNDDEIGKLKRDPYNGFSKGNLFFLRGVEKPRLEETYLRYSLPMFTIQYLGRKSKKEPTIYIIPGGGVFYSERDYPFFSENELIIRKLKRNYQNIDIKFIVCFLKSSLNLFYCMNKFDSDDIYRNEVFNRIRLPSINLKIPDIREKAERIERNFDKIIELEKEVCKGKKGEDIERYVKLIDAHNKKVDKLAYEIDLLIYDILEISQTEVSKIEENLRLNNIFIPEFKENNKNE